jgi:hypothetical protein
MGCWSIGTDTTVVGLVTNATFSNFAKLCQGGYGSRPLQAGHTLVAVNPDWTGPQDIGQFWDRWVLQTAVGDSHTSCVGRQQLCLRYNFD